MKEALRQIARSPWQTAVILVSLALGTGANAAIYSAVDALLFRPPAGVLQPSSLVDIYTSEMNGGTFGNSSYPDFLAIQAAASLDSAAAVSDLDESAIHIGDRVANARVAAVTASFWNTLRAEPANGAFEPGVVISTKLWRELGSDAGVVGHAIAVGAREFRVSAVAPDRFRGLHLDRVFDVWVPLDAKAETRRGDRRLSIVGRLRDGASTATLERELSATATRLSRDYPETNQGTLRNPDESRRITAAPYARLDSAVRSRAALFGTALFGAAVLLLVSACVNAGSLMLSRGMARRVELTIKIALGADRARLVREVVLEGLLVALAGSLAGLLAAAWTAGAIPALFAPEHAALLDVHVELPVIATTMLLGLLAGATFAFAPALISTRNLVASALRADAGGLGHRHGGVRLRMILVGTQLATSTLFLIAATLLVRFADASLAAARSWAAGELVLASIESYDPGYRDHTLDRLRALRSVTRVGWVATPPLGRAPRREFTIAHGPNTELIDVDVNFASPGYFSAMYIHEIDGRLLQDADERRTHDVAVVNAALAQHYFAGRAVGRMLVDARGNEIEIVGIVNPRSFRAFEGVQRPTVYLPMSRATSRGFYAVLRADAGAANVEREAAAALDAAGGATKVEVFPFDVFLERALAPDRLVGVLIAVCGSLVLVLALVGVYGVMIDAARRRRREFGLRAALGASHTQILAALVGSSLAPAAAGVGLGIAAAFVLARVAASFVFGLPAIEPLLVVAIVGLMVLVVLLSVAAPARSALRVSPLVALRDQ